MARSTNPSAAPEASASGAPSPSGAMAMPSNPWEYLNTARGMDLSARQPLLQPWLDLVGKQPGHERDALLSEGREIWKYRMDTVRVHMRQIEEVERGLSRSAVTVVNDELIAETVYRPGTEQEVGYLVHY